MEDLILQVITKVREMYKFDNRLKEIIKQNANVELRERDGKLELSSISFNWYDSLVICNGKIVYKPEYGNNEVLYTYNKLEDLLSA